MGVTLYYCKFCKECLHSDDFVSCDCCQENLYVDDYNMVCDHCINLKRFERNHVTITHFKDLVVTLMCDKCITNEELCDFDEILNDKYFKEHPEYINHRLKYDKLVQIIRLHKNKFFNANNEKYKDAISKIINLLKEINV
jgi:hypothetical protein